MKLEKKKELTQSLQRAQRTQRREEHSQEWLCHGGNLGCVEAPDYQEGKEEEEEAEGGLVFVVFAVLGPGEGAGGGGCWFWRGQAWKKEGDGVGIGVEGGAVMAAEFDFFSAHDEGVDEGKIEEEEGGGEPGVHGNGGAEGEDAAAEVERIAGAGVRAGGGEDGLFVEIAGGVGADGEAEEADAGADQNRARGGVRKI